MEYNRLYSISIRGNFLRHHHHHKLVSGVILSLLTKVLTYSVFRAIAGRIFDAIVAGIHVLRNTNNAIIIMLVHIEMPFTPGSGISLLTKIGIWRIIITVINKPTPAITIFSVISNLLIPFPVEPSALLI